MIAYFLIFRTVTRIRGVGFEEGRDLLFNPKESLEDGASNAHNSALADHSVFMKRRLIQPTGRSAIKLKRTIAL